MNSKFMKLLNALTLWIVCVVMATSSFAAQTRPNIVMLYIDDWAWNGTPVPMNDSMENSFMPILKMPNLERLAEQGMKFTNAYGSPQCAPARVCIQTGQSTPRNGYTLVLGKVKHDYRLLWTTRQQRFP